MQPLANKIAPAQMVVEKEQRVRDIFILLLDFDLIPSHCSRDVAEPVYEKPPHQSQGNDQKPDH